MSMWRRSSPAVRLGLFNSAAELSGKLFKMNKGRGLAGSVPLTAVTTPGCSLQAEGCGAIWGPPGNALRGKGSSRSGNGNKSSTKNCDSKVG